MGDIKIEPLTEAGIILIVLLASGVIYKIANKVLASNCTKVNCCGASCERPPLDNEDALEILNNQSHAKQTLHEVVIEEIKKDIES